MAKDTPLRYIDTPLSGASGNVVIRAGAVTTVESPAHDHDDDYADAGQFATHLAAYAAHIIDADAHHDEEHGILSHTASATEGQLLAATTTDTVGWLTPTSDGAANQGVPLVSDGFGRIKLSGITVSSIFSPTDVNLALIPAGTGVVTTTGDLRVQSGGILYTPEVATASGNLTLDPAGGAVSVDGSLATSTSLAAGTSATVGTTLQVGGDVILTDYATIGGSGNVLAANLTAGTSLLIEANSTDALRVDSTGDTRAIQQLKVGADTAPAYTLDVSGTANVSGNVYANSNLIVTGDVDAANADIPGTLELGTLKAQSSGADLNIAANEVQFKSYAGTNLWKVLSDGTLRSNNFDAVTDAGWSIGPDGQNFGNVNIRGSLMTMILEYQQMLVGAGRQLFRPGGKLHANLIINTTDGDYTYDVHLTDPAIGPEQVALVGDWLYIRGLAYSAPESAATGAAIPYWMFVPLAASGAVSLGVREAWMKVTGTPVYDTDHWYYPCTMAPSVSDLGRYAWPAGTAVANRGAAGDGAVMVDSENIEGPFLDIHTLTEAAGVPGIASHVRLGALRTASIGNAGEWGMIAAANLQSNTGSYLIASNQRLEMRNPDIVVKSASNETAAILGADGLFLAAPTIGAAEYFDYYQDDYHLRPMRLDTEINFSLDIDDGDQDDYAMASIYAERYDRFWGNIDVPPAEQINHIYVGRVAVEARKTTVMDMLRNDLMLISKYQVSESLWTSAAITLSSTETSGAVTLDPTGNFDADQGATVALRGDVKMYGRPSYITASNILRLFLKSIPLSSDGETADVTGEPIDDDQVYRTAAGVLMVRI